MLNTSILKSYEFILIQSVILLVLIALVIVMPQLALIAMLIALVAGSGTYIILLQRQTITNLQTELTLECKKNDAYILRTEQLRRTLHNIRSPMSALKLRLHILQKNSNASDKQHIELLEQSLEKAIQQLDTMSAIQKGKIAPTESIIMQLDEIRAYLNE